MKENINIESQILKNIYEINKLFMQNINILSLNKFFEKDNFDNRQRVFAYINDKTNNLMVAMIRDNFNKKDADLLLNELYIEITTRLTNCETQSGQYKIH